MSFNFNATTAYNGMFNQKTSIKPLAGFLTHEMYLNNLLTAVNHTKETLLAGQLVELTTNAKQSSGLVGLNPNVLEISVNPVGEGANSMSSIIVHNITDFVMPADKAPALRNTQTTYVASVGMGVELYLPCDLTLLGKTNRVKLYYNATTNTYSAESAGAIQLGNGEVTLCGNVVEGQQIVFDSTNTEQTIFKDCYVIKVKI